MSVAERYEASAFGAATDQVARPGSVCFVATGPPMLRLLTGEGPDAMGGAELQLSMLAGYLRERGWDVTFLVGDYGQEREIVTHEGIRLLKAYPQSDAKKSPAGALRDASRFWRTLAKADAQAYICRGLTGQAGVVASWCSSYGRPYIFWFAKNADALYGVPWLSSLPLVERLPAASAIQSADAVVLQTNEQGELLHKHFGREGFLIRNAIAAAEGAANGDRGGFVLWVGSMQPKKRPDMLLEMAAWLPEVQFVMIGGPVKSHPQLHERIVSEAAGLPNVDYRGFTPYEETEELFNEASVLVSTSDGVGEGFPNVFLQAWAAGAVVLSRCDPDGVIKANDIGRCFHSSADGIERLQSLLEAPEERVGLARRAREHVHGEHSIATTGARLEKLLRSLTGNNEGLVAATC